jgi:peptidoglycan/xylan/chitin deacetylase (PgdA/CDA1 family)
MSAATPQHGAFVLSLDFELHWGVRDQTPADGDYQRNILGARTAIPAILRLFEEYGIAATWATVGFLFARDQAEMRSHFPSTRPAYRDPRFDPYAQSVGVDETADPLHFAASLIEQIRATPRQEIGTHTFSHYYCLERGQTKEAFRADLKAAASIADAHGVRLRSIVFPRNQHNPAYDDVLHDAGVIAYRGNQTGWMYRATESADNSPVMRIGRLADTYLPVMSRRATEWSSIRQPNGLCNVPANHFLRPYSPRLRALEPLRKQRIAASIKRAASGHRVVHLWWHPHNFGIHLDENLNMLRSVLEVFARCRETHQMKSLTMAEVADLCGPSSKKHAA